MSQTAQKEPTHTEQLDAAVANPGKRLLTFLADEEIYHLLLLEAVRHGYDDWKTYLNDLLKHSLL